MSKRTKAPGDSGAPAPLDSQSRIEVVAEIFARAREIQTLAREQDFHLIDYLMGLVEAEAYDLMARALPEELDRAEQALLERDCEPDKAKIRIVKAG